MFLLLIFTILSSNFIKISQLDFFFLPTYMINAVYIRKKNNPSSRRKGVTVQMIILLLYTARSHTVKKSSCEAGKLFVQ